MQAQARRYVNHVRTMGMLEMAMWRGSRTIRMVNFALKAGSSKQGKAARAKVASNWVEASTLKKSKTKLVFGLFHMPALS